MVEQRGMGWNFPSGNEDIVYFIYTFYNVTSIDPADLCRGAARHAGNPDPAGQYVPAAERGDVRHHLPDGGYTIENMFANFSADMDVGTPASELRLGQRPVPAGVHLRAMRSPSLPGGASTTTRSSGPPFFKGTGFVGVKYLKSPEIAGVEVGLSLFSNTTNGGGDLNDPADVKQLYRYISGTLSTSLR